MKEQHEAFDSQWPDRVGSGAQMRIIATLAQELHATLHPPGAMIKEHLGCHRHGPAVRKHLLRLHNKKKKKINSFFFIASLGTRLHALLALISLKSNHLATRM
jgi:hypothetical protein